MKRFLVNILNFTLHCVNDVSLWYFHVIPSGFDGHREAVWCPRCWGSPFSSCLYFLNLCRGISMCDSVCIARHDWKWFKSIISANNKLISICWRNYRPRFFHWVVTTGYSLILYLAKAFWSHRVQKASNYAMNCIFVGALWCFFWCRSTCRYPCCQWGFFPHHFGTRLYDRGKRSHKTEN